jgi:hypothetical protein
MLKFSALALGTLLLASSTLAAGADTVAPLAPGKPAGVSQAAREGNGMLLLFGAAIVAGGIALVVSQGNSGNSITSTTSSTAP